MRLLLYASDVPWGSEVDRAVQDWLDALRDVDGVKPERPVIRLELLAEGRTAVDVVAGMFDWGDRGWVTHRPAGCVEDRRLLLRRFAFDAVPPTCVLPYFRPEGE